MRIADFALERYFARWEFAARHLLCASDVQGYPMSDLLALADDEMRTLWADLRLGYSESTGHPLLRREIASLYESIEPDEILTFAGAEEAIFCLANVLVGPGDHVIATWPGYQSLYEIARAAGADVTLHELREEARWVLDLDLLRRQITPATKLMVVNAPHNPTGMLPDRATFDGLTAIAAEAGAHLIVDEVYRGLERKPDRELPPACLAYENGISLNVLSKTAGLAGLRIGWLASSRTDVLDSVAVVKDYNSICSSGPSEFLASIAVRNFNLLAGRNHALCATNLALFEAFVSRHPDFVALTPPEGSSIAFPRLAGRAEAAFGGDAERMALALLADAGVLLLPGKLYDYDARHWRLGYGRADFAEGLGELEAWVGARGY